MSPLMHSLIRCVALKRTAGDPEPGLRVTGGGAGGPGGGGLADLFKGRLDLGRVAVVGHSYGGATAALVTATEGSVRAGVCLDPW